jgi:hypothetical protein
MLIQFSFKANVRLNEQIFLAAVFSRSAKMLAVNFSVGDAG